MTVEKKAKKMKVLDQLIKNKKTYKQSDNKIEEHFSKLKKIMDLLLM